MAAGPVPEGIEGRNASLSPVAVVAGVELLGLAAEWVLRSKGGGVWEAAAYAHVLPEVTVRRLHRTPVAATHRLLLFPLQAGQAVLPPEMLRQVCRCLRHQAARVTDQMTRLPCPVPQCLVRGQMLS